MTTDHYTIKDIKQSVFVILDNIFGDNPIYLTVKKAIGDSIDTFKIGDGRVYKTDHSPEPNVSENCAVYNLNGDRVNGGTNSDVVTNLKSSGNVKLYAGANVGSSFDKGDVLIGNNLNHQEEFHFDAKSINSNGGGAVFGFDKGDKLYIDNSNYHNDAIIFKTTQFSTLVQYTNNDGSKSIINVNHLQNGFDINDIYYQ
ncbi:hypothetical protein ACFQ3K_01490 [Brucella gallinifaecis]|uniref:Uncharacterized protein n=1 Tax=Brucella gallinifaecis TaxID=215590 RepID=A0A502BJR7_9HYPH|nr:hypothetical protein [Brucella gallinifaecis]TPF73921.1 hypothetical protein FHY56_17300 [Brucella gallinifaecis]